MPGTARKSGEPHNLMADTTGRASRQPERTLEREHARQRLAAGFDHAAAGGAPAQLLQPRQHEHAAGSVRERVGRVQHVAQVQALGTCAGEGRKSVGQPAWHPLLKHAHAHSCLCRAVSETHVGKRRPEGLGMSQW